MKMELDISNNFYKAQKTAIDLMMYIQKSEPRKKEVCATSTSTGEREISKERV